VVKLGRCESVWKSSLLDILAEIKERSRRRIDLHFPRAAKEFMANEAWGATNCSMFPFRRPRRRAVRDLLLLCTRAPMSRRWTRGDRGVGVMCAFFEGQIVRTKRLKLWGVM